MATSFSSTARALIVTAALVIIIAGMKLAASLLVPLLLSVFIAVISFPLMIRLQQQGLPKGLSITLVLLLTVLIGFSLMLLIGNSLTDFSQMLPEYKQKLSAEWDLGIQWIAERGIAVPNNIRDVIDPTAAMGLASSIFKGFGNLLSKFFLILLVVVFILAEAAGFMQKLAPVDNEDGSQTTSDEKTFAQVFVEKLRNYMGIKTIMSMITGVVIGVAMWLIGVDYPVLWGALAFMLNFVPSIGSIIAAVPAVLLTLVQLGFNTALLVTAVYLVVNISISSFIEPRYMGKGLGLSIVVVFVSLVFWGWVLGPVGMLLSVPLTITVKLALDSKPETQKMGHLLGPVDER
jgi:predicted PurR-regulated permease PerM